MKGRPIKGGDPPATVGLRPGLGASMKGRPIKSGNRVPILGAVTWVSQAACFARRLQPGPARPEHVRATRLIGSGSSLPGRPLVI